MRERPGPAARAVEAVIERLPKPVRMAIEGEDLLLLSAGLAFYSLVSVIPMAIVALWLASLMVGDGQVRELADALSKYAPKNLGVDRALIRVADVGTSLGVAAVVSALWPASSYGSALRRAFLRFGPGPGRRLEGLRGRGLALMVLLPVLVLGTLAGAFVATSVFEEGVARILGWLLALPFAFVAASAALALIYRILPVEPLAWRQLLRATLIAATGIAVLSVAYAVYLAGGADFEQHYAISGLAGLVLLAGWLFLSNALVLVGYRVARGR